MGRKKSRRTRYQLTFLHKLIIGMFLVLGIVCIGNPQAYHFTLEENLPENRISFLQKGDYVLDVTYSSPAGNAVVVSSNEVAGADNRMGGELVRREIAEGAGVVRIELSLDQGVYGIHVGTQLDNESAFYIGRLEVWSLRLQNTDHYFLALLCLLAAFATALLGLFVPVEKYRDAAVLLGIGLVASLPLFSDFIYEGNDFRFHMARIEGLYQGLLAGDFPVRINPVQISGYGSLSATMYPQLFLYPIALLRFGRISLMLCYKLLLVAVNIGSAAFAFYGVKNICKSRRIAFAASILYTFSLYRLNNLYFRAALGETLAMVFLPLVIWGIYEVLWGDRRKWYILMFGMTGVLQSHVLSTELCVLFLLPEVAYWAVKGSRKEFWKRLLAGTKAAVLTIFLNASFLVPFLFFCGENLQSFRMENEVPATGAYFSQMFASYMIPAGASLEPGATQGEMPLTVGGLLAVGAVLFCISCSRQKEKTAENQLGKHCLVFGLCSLLLSSWLFPWEKLTGLELINTLSTPLQFAWRFLGPASIFLCITAAVGFVRFAENWDKRWIYGAVAAVTFCSAGYFFDMLSSEMEQTCDKMLLESYRVSDSMYMYGDGDSFKAFHLDYDSEEAYIKTAGGTGVEYSGYAKNGSRIRVHTVPEPDSNTENGQDFLLFPLYYFPGYEVRINGEPAQVTSIGTLVACRLPKTPADIQVRYRGRASFHIADWVTLATVLGIAAWSIALFARKKRRRDVL